MNPVPDGRVVIVCALATWLVIEANRIATQHQARRTIAVNTDTGDRVVFNFRGANRTSVTGTKAILVRHFENIWNTPVACKIGREVETAKPKLAHNETYWGALCR